MAITYKATFKPEKRKDKSGYLLTIDVPLMMDLSYYGRSWYSTGIRLQDIKDFDIGEQKLTSGKKAYMNKQLTSSTQINKELENIKAYLNEAFNTARALKKPITAKSLIQDLKILSGQVKIEEIKKNTISEEFLIFTEDRVKKNIINDERERQYKSFAKMLDRFLKIEKLSKEPVESINLDMIDKFQQFLFQEHTYIDKYPELYEDMTKKELPKERNQNTAASKLRLFKAFCNSLDRKDKIAKNPFNKMEDKERSEMLSEGYDEPVYLTLKELLHIVESDVPESLQRVKDCFLLHCAIGCRVGNFNNMTWKNVRTEYGFYYIHYVPSKIDRKKNIKPIDTPIVKFAVPILEKYKEELPNEILVPNFKGNVNGKNGYNVQIKKLFEYLKMERYVFIKKGDKDVPVKICNIVSSKTSRKTHVDITAKVKLKKNISGLHKDNSKAVDRYTSLNIQEKYELYNMAFEQPEYTIKKENE